MDFCYGAAILILLVVGGTVWLCARSARRETSAAVARQESIRTQLAGLTSLRADGGAVSVVGESHYAWALKQLSEADDRGARKRAHTAWLLAEPDNPHDHNAVQVLIGEQVVGYLSAARAVKYQPLVARAVSAGYKITCAAEIAGGWIAEDGDQRDFGVTLALATPKALEKLLDERVP